MAPHIREILLTEAGLLGCIRFWPVMGCYKIQAGAGCEPRCSRDFYECEESFPGATEAQGLDLVLQYVTLLLLGNL